MTLIELRKELNRFFTKNDIDSPEVTSGLLIMEYFKLSKARLLLDNRAVTDEEYEALKKMAERRVAGEPVQYITGHAPFMDLDFRVNSSTLIPRPDTEILVEEILNHIPKEENLHLWDIGCGSGCIGISLAYYRKNITVTEIDISEKALKTAQINAENIGVADRIKFINQDILSGMPKAAQPQIIVSNPPYILSDVIDTLQTEVKKYEPLAALDGGADGLVFYRKIVADAPLEDDGMLAFEIGYDQGKQVRALMKNNGYKNVRIIKDLSGNDRVVLGYK